MRGLAVQSIGIGILLFAVAGCGVNFYAGRPSDVHRIHELSAELERLQLQKLAEADQLKDAQVMLEEKLRKEIGDKQVKLEMAERGLVLTFLTEVLFDSEKANLRSEANETLGKVASVIRQKVADRDVGIEGHTDNEPIKVSGWKSNWELSTSRATAVLHALEGSGVNPHRLVATGYGEYRPVVCNDTLDGRQQNRRVEIVILPKKLSRVEQALLREAESFNEPEIREKARALEEYK